MWYSLCAITILLYYFADMWLLLFQRECVQMEWNTESADLSVLIPVIATLVRIPVSHYDVLLEAASALTIT